MSLLLLAGVACALLFHRAADHERMSPLLWSGASVLLTAAIAAGAGGRIGAILLAQAGLFLVMWIYNASRRRYR